MSDWRPIQSAPKDGTIIDVWVAASPRLGEREGRRVARWDVTKEKWWAVNKMYYLNPPPTYWMPMPDPPADLPGALRPIAVTESVAPNDGAAHLASLQIYHQNT